MNKRWITVIDLPYYGQTGHCWYCGEKPPRKRRNWCGKACVHEYRLRAHSSYARRYVRYRDKGQCTACLLRTKDLQTALLQLLESDSARAMKVAKRLKISIRYKRRKPVIKGMWDVDHIIPVKYGGGSCGLEGLQTLCTWCHKLKTHHRSAKVLGWYVKSKRTIEQLIGSGGLAQLPNLSIKERS